MPLHADHDRSAFSCGAPALDRYLREQARQDQKRGLAVVYVVTRLDARQVIGYYTLSSLSIPLGDMPATMCSRLPRYPHVPATLMGRLAVDLEARAPELRLGEHLLMDALERSLRASERVASYAIVVDALDVDPDPVRFYERYGFQRLPDHPRRLVLPMATIRQVLG